MNVGASKPSDAGLYFQWGDTQGYTADQVGKDKQFNLANYKWSIDGSSSNFRKYTTTGAILELEDDAAHANMGGDWHMPTYTQIWELLNTKYTTNTWTTQNGMNGRLFTSKTDASKSIFFPAAGSAWDGSLGSSGDYGFVWTSLLSTSSFGDGAILCVNSHSAGQTNGSRVNGFSVRGVLDK